MQSAERWSTDDYWYEPVRQKLAVRFLQQKQVSGYRFITKLNQVKTLVVGQILQDAINKMERRFINCPLDIVGTTVFI